MNAASLFSTSGAHSAAAAPALADRRDDRAGQDFVKALDASSDPVKPIIDDAPGFLDERPELSGLPVTPDLRTEAPGWPDEKPDLTDAPVTPDDATPGVDPLILLTHKLAMSMLGQYTNLSDVPSVPDSQS